jgi:hypothetical protein
VSLIEALLRCRFARSSTQAALWAQLHHRRLFSCARMLMQRRLRGGFELFFPCRGSEQAVEPATDIALGDVAAAHDEAQ